MIGRITMPPVVIIVISLSIIPLCRVQAQKYIPLSSTSEETASVVLDYSNKPGSQRPSASLKFKDGTVIHLNAVCEGYYPWCMRVYDKDKIVDLGSLKIVFSRKKSFISLKVRPSEGNMKYRKYLRVINGKFKQVNG
jgi:hypothetical protein